MTDQNISKPRRRMARMVAEKVAPDGDSAMPQADKTAATPPRAASKIALVTRLLERSEGSTLDDLKTATGWLSHTTRAALTGLKKKGKVITKGKRDDVTCYFIAGPGA